MDNYPDCSIYYEFEEVFPEECCGDPTDCSKAVSDSCEKDEDDA